MLEKHFTDDKKKPGNDHYHAMDANDLKKLIGNIELIVDLIGESGLKAPIPSEQIARKNARRSIVTKRALLAGETITADVLTYKRPATGISTLHWFDIIGKKVRRNLPEDSIFTMVRYLVMSGAENRSFVSRPV